MLRLTKPQLGDKLQAAIRSSGYRFLIVEPAHPFLFRIYPQPEAGEGAWDVRIYIWNLTHGGGPARAVDEFRIQITGAVPKIHAARESTLILGWYEDLQIFAAFDIAHHNEQAGSSPSIQVKLSVLEAAASEGFSAYERGNQEIAVAFRPEFLVDYALRRDALHKSTTGLRAFVEKLSHVAKLPDVDVASEPDPERREVLVQLRKKHRAADFRNRILEAYARRCAMCGAQLGLVEAAHILPVAVKGSTDVTPNGVALCVLHHRAFDANLVSFTHGYRIEISAKRAGDLEDAGLAGGIKGFSRGLQKVLLLPTRRVNHPDPKFINAGRKARGWLN